MSHVKIVYDAEKGILVPEGEKGHHQIQPRQGFRQICYVDDSRTAAFVTKKLLVQKGYDVRHYDDANMALEAILDQDFDLIITDLMITDKDGVNGDDLIRIIRNSGHPIKSKIPVIVITGDQNVDTHQALTEAGANCVLTKPVDAEALYTSIRELEGHTDAVEDVIEEAYIEDTTDTELPESSISHDFSTEIEVSSEPIEHVVDSSELSISDENEFEIQDKFNNQSKTTVEETSFDAEDELPDWLTETISEVDTANELPVDPHVFETSDETDKEIESILSAEDNFSEIDVSSFTDEHLIPILTEEVSRRPMPDSSEFVNKKESIVDWNDEDVIPPLDLIPPVEPEDVEHHLNEKFYSHQSSILPTIIEDDSLDTMDFTPAVEYEKPEENNVSNAKEEVTAAKPEPRKATVEPTPVIPVTPHRTVEAQNAGAIKNTAMEEENPLLALLENLDEKPSKNKIRAKTSFDVSSFLQAKTAVVGLVIAVVAVLVLWIVTDSGTPVRLALVERGDIHRSLSLTGVLASNKKIDVTSFFPGQLSELTVKEGEKVKKDQVLAKLDGREVSSSVKRAQAALMSVKEDVALTSKTMERLQKALNIGAVSRQRVEDAEAAWKSASARQSVAEEELKAAKLMKERLKIVAPFDGLVTTTQAQAGQWIAPPDPILTLVNLSQREIELKVDAVDSSILNIGQPVTIHTAAFGGKTWEETITRIASSTRQENQNNQINVYVSLSKDAPDLRLGQQVDATIRLASSENTLILPYQAVKEFNGQKMVAVAINNRVHYVGVSTGIEDYSHIEVVKGLQEKQEVLLLPENVLLEEGDKVDINP
ncbi:MAG: efflux RND transporter periplasmic adaptor subunit [Gammaproteobacteria bacterium]|nr:efflux RND transporter periplasmic adaptor subunit [Gammaproteobacteria bacterium]